MDIPDISLRSLLEAGVHFGHTPRRWNPKMAPYIFGVRNGVHILDLEQTQPLMREALEFLRATGARGGRCLFVGTKPQAARAVADAATRSAQYYVNHRWLGGMLTNWRTVSESIRLLRELEARIDPEEGAEPEVMTKKERVRITRRRDKLERALGGIREMGGVPDALFVIDTNREEIAISEARRLGIPVVAVVDSNGDPDAIDYPIPGNDDATRAIVFYLERAADAILLGLQEHQGRAAEESGGDAGESEQPMEPVLLAAAPQADAPPSGASGAEEGRAEVESASGEPTPGKAGEEDEGRDAP